MEALAAATPAAVLRAWQGLGYDRRAIALWRTARIVVDEHGGRVPSTVAELQALPGIGPYTARAVAALAFGEPVGAVDVNVRRVLGRIVAGDAGALSAPALQDVADDAVPTDRPGDWTHALMDVGAILCRPRAPRCDACPARPWCRLASRGGTDNARRAPPSASAQPPSASPQRTAGSAAGSSTGCARRRTGIGSPSTARSGPTTSGRSGPPPTPWPPTVSSRSDRPRVRTQPFERACPSPDPSSAVGYAWLAMSSTSLPAGDRRDATPDAAGMGSLPANDPSIFEMDLRELRRRWADRAAMPAIGAEAMTGADRRAQALGVSEERLMEHAGTAVAAAVRALAVDTGRWGTGPIVILCGPGNNGGDGFVAARRLALAGAQVVVAVVATEARPRGAAASRNWDRIARDIGISQGPRPGRP